jgi:hypothetical protein
MKTTAVVKKSMLFEPGSAPADAKDEYSNIETIYTNYKIGNIDSSIFKTESYLYKESDEFKPSKKYDFYKIIKATPKL